MSTPVVVSSGNITGNIGSCSITSQDISVSSWTMETVAVNSCTGVVVADNTYFAWGNLILVVVAILVGIMFALGFIRLIFD